MASASSNVQWSSPPTLASCIDKISQCMEAAQGGASFTTLCDDVYSSYVHAAVKALGKKADVEEVLCVSHTSAPVVLSFLLDVLLCRTKYRNLVLADMRVLLRAPSWATALTVEHALVEKVKQLPKHVQDAFAEIHAQHLIEDQEADLGCAEAPHAASTDGRNPTVWQFWTDDHEEKANEKIKEDWDAANDLLRANGTRILILGAAGAGKSAVVNAVFQKSLAESGMGKSVTSGISHYEPTDACPIHIYDTKGFEPLQDNSDLQEQVKGLLRERKEASLQHESGDQRQVLERIHAVWWIVAVRFDPKLNECVKEMFEGYEVPVFIVVNKCDSPGRDVDEIMSQICDQCKWAAAVIPMVALPKHGPFKLSCERCGSGDIAIHAKRRYYRCDCCQETTAWKKCYGGAALVLETAEHLPDLVAQSFLSAQKEWLSGLDHAAHLVIRNHVLLAIGVGAAPLPFTDVAILYANEIWMVHRLVKCYGLIASSKTTAHLVRSTTGLCAGGIGAKLIASLAKAMPGIGALGACTDAVIAGSVTLALGYLTRALLRKVRGSALAAEVTIEDFKRSMDTGRQQELFVEYFNKAKQMLTEGLLAGNLNNLEIR